MSDEYLFPEIDSIVHAHQMSVLLEVSGEPKPGNVTEIRGFEDIGYHDFIYSALNIDEPLSRIYREGREADGTRGLWGGALLEGSRKAIPEGRNTIFGTLLIEIPVGLAAVRASARDSVIEVAGSVVDGSGPQDAVYFCRSIRHCNVGGLEHSSMTREGRGLDLLDPELEDRIRAENITLKELLAPSVTYDLVARDVLEGYGLSLKTARRYLAYIRDLGDPKQACGATFMWLLSSHQDSLIARQAGKEVASSVKSRAQAIMRREAFSDSWIQGALELDGFLRKRDLNPGTLADITASGIFLLLLGVVD